MIRKGTRTDRILAAVWAAGMLALLAAVAAFECSLIVGCSKSGTAAVPAVTARVLTDADIRASLGAVYCGDSKYAEVSSASLRAYYDDFRQSLFDQGVTKWDDRFDCNHFAGSYVDRAQTKFYFAHFQSRTPAQTLALGVFWYQSARGPHAIVAAFTERGLIFIEPQTGGELQLTTAERASAWLKVF